MRSGLVHHTSRYMVVNVVEEHSGSIFICCQNLEAVCSY